MEAKNISQIITWNKDGLIPAIAQDYLSKEVLMMAYMNEESLKLTLQTGIVHYFSRSRNALWKKGETSGQLQELHKISIDCDGDTLLLLVKQLGKPLGVACHTGRKSCFFYDVKKDGKLDINQEILITKEELYGSKK